MKDMNASQRQSIDGYELYAVDAVDTITSMFQDVESAIDDAIEKNGREVRVVLGLARFKRAFITRWTTADAIQKIRDHSR